MSPLPAQSTTGSPLPRLLALVPYLTQHPDARFEDLARVFGVSRAQIEKDITHTLWVVGLPGYGPGDLIDFELQEDTVSVTMTAGVERPLRLTADEALPLVVALQALADIPVPGLDDASGSAGRDVVRRALAKILDVAGPAAAAGDNVNVVLGGEVGAGGAGGAGTAQEDQVASTLGAALEQGRRVHLRYLPAGRDEVTERDVDPIRLLAVDGRRYLEGWCRLAEAVRLFRLDRVLAATVLALPAEPPAHATTKDLAEGLFAPSPDDPTVLLRLGARARWLVEDYACEVVADPAPGHPDDLVVALRTPDTRWLERLLVGLGGSAVVLEPEAVAERVRARATEALAAYDEVQGAR